jgi:5-deoxy-glucuronate isomerase
MTETLAARGRETVWIGLELLRLSAGERTIVHGHGSELCAVLLEGTIDVTAGGETRPAAREGGVFRAPPVAAYAPPGDAVELFAQTDAQLAVASAPLDGARPGAARLIAPTDGQLREAGSGNWSRTIRTLLGPGDEAGRLVLGETISPPGNWSSYPPHRHDRDAPPALEEVYYYRFEPSQGFGVQLLYDDESERAQIVHDGDAVAIPSGYHPVVAAPGYSLYYLWVLAGEGRELDPYVEPAHAWVQSGA